MSIFQRIWGKKSRDKPKNYLSTAFTFLFGPTSSGNVVTERTAMQTTAVYACVRVLSEAIAGLPLNLYRYTPDGGREKTINHPLYRLLHDAPHAPRSYLLFQNGKFCQPGFRFLCSRCQMLHHLPDIRKDTDGLHPVLLPL